MSTTTTLDPKKRIPHLSRPKDTFDPKPPAHLVTLLLTWGVWDITADATTTFEADGGHFQSLPGHRYLIFLRVTDVHGIKRITLDGSGFFSSSTDPDKNGQSHIATINLPASIHHAAFDSATGKEKLQSLVVVMNPDIGAFDYSRISCGFHNFGNTGTLEYFADGGLMKFAATAINSHGDTGTATLTTAP